MFCDIADQAKHYYKKSGHNGPILLRVANAGFPGAVDAAQLYQQSCAKAGIALEIQRVPDDGFWSEVWNKQPFCNTYWSGRATQDQMYSTTYLSTAVWNDTHFSNEKFDKLLIEARAELDQDKRKNLYREIAIIVHDEGGVIVPMFNQAVDAISDKVGGYVAWHDALMNSLAFAKCWLKA